MNAKTHILIGGMAGFYAYPTVTGFVSGAFCALLPDIDKANSKLGRKVWPLSLFLERAVGHRTITHSWIVLLLPALPFFSLHPAIGHACLYGILSHLLSDMLVGRIQFFWPIRQGWIGIRLPRSLYSLVDTCAFFASCFAIGYWLYHHPHVLLTLRLY